MDMTDSGDLLDSKYDESFHPPAPPIKDDGGQMEASSEVLKFDSNFLMAKPGVSDAIRHVSLNTISYSYSLYLKLLSS